MSIMEEAMQSQIEGSLHNQNLLYEKAEELLKDKIVNCKNSTTIFDTNNYIKYEDALKVIVNLIK